MRMVRARSALIGRLPSLAVIDDIGQRSLVLGFPFMTLGMIAGAVLASAHYGRGYFEDPKVVLSLLMWALYLLLLVARWTAGWRGRRAAVLSAVAFVWNQGRFSTAFPARDPQRVPCSVIFGCHTTRTS